MAVHSTWTSARDLTMIVQSSTTASTLGEKMSKRSCEKQRLQRLQSLRESTTMRQAMREIPSTLKQPTPELR